MSNTVNILHLSDLHFGYKSIKNNKSKYVENPSLKIINDAFTDFFSHENYKHHIDYILITGDITDSGDKMEFELAEKFLNKLIEKRPDCKISVCLGNHDIFIGKVGKTGIENFNNFRNKYLYNNILLNGCYHDEEKNIFFVTLNDYITLDAVKKRIAGEEVKFSLENDKVDEIFVHIKKINPALVITLMHFPHYFFLEKVYIPTNYFLTSFDTVKKFSDILLTGHLHGADVIPDLLSYKTLCFHGGILCKKKDTDKLSCRLLKIDIENKTVKNYPYNYEKDSWKQSSPENIFSYNLSYFNEQAKINDLKHQNNTETKVNHNYDFDLLNYKRFIIENTEDVIVKKYFNCPNIEKKNDGYLIEGVNQIIIKLIKINEVSNIDNLEIFTDANKITHVLFYGQDIESFDYVELKKKYEKEIINRKLILHLPIKIE